MVVSGTAVVVGGTAVVVGGRAVVVGGGGTVVVGGTNVVVDGRAVVVGGTAVVFGGRSVVVGSIVDVGTVGRIVGRGFPNSSSSPSFGLPQLPTMHIATRRNTICNFIISLIYSLFAPK